MKIISESFLIDKMYIVIVVIIISIL